MSRVCHEVVRVVEAFVARGSGRTVRRVWVCLELADGATQCLQLSPEQARDLVRLLDGVAAVDIEGGN